jgi:hypothetical protein
MIMVSTIGTHSLLNALLGWAAKLLLGHFCLRAVEVKRLSDTCLGWSTRW